jgi:hypothetical protein
MWAILNETPFAAKGAIRLHPKTGRMIWLMAIKATFDLHEDESLTIAEQQEEVLEKPVYSGEKGVSSLLYDCDLPGLKEKVDLLLNGTAYQPGGKPASKLFVGFGIDRWSKTLKIVGDRLWDRFLGMTLVIGPDPFQKMAITYENAYGGMDEKAKPHLQCYQYNSVGKGYAAKQRKLFGKKLPTIEYPDFPTKANYKRNQVAGFGAIPDSWKPRIEHGGTYDEQWDQIRSPLLPQDFSPAFYQSAPKDQQLSYLSGGERVTLLNLMPNRSQFGFNLPQVEFRLFTRIRGSIAPHTAGLKTVIIEPDKPRLILVWHSAIECHNAQTRIETTTIEGDIKQMKQPLHHQAKKQPVPN